MKEINLALKEIVEKELTGGVFDEVVSMRRHIHMHPCVGIFTEETEAYVKEKLAAYGIEILPSKTGILAVIKGKCHDQLVALRADMDALPLTEENDVPYRSTYEGKMHACGHDSHTAMLLGAAKILAAHREELPYDVLLVFQPSEEGPIISGAYEMLKDMDELGLTEKIMVMFGQHVFNNADAGKVGTRYGSVSASTDVFTLKFIGSGGHCAEPDKSIDALSLGVRFVTEMESFMSRRIDPFDNAICAIGTFHAGTACNIIPETATLTASVRCQREATRGIILDHVKKIAEGICHGWDATFELDVTRGLPCLVNNDDATTYARAVAKQILGEENYYDIPTPMMGAEDFAYFSERVPACFLNVGARNEAKGFTAKVHSPRFDIDEACLAAGVKMLCALAANVE